MVLYHQRQDMFLCGPHRKLIDPLLLTMLSCSCRKPETHGSYLFSSSSQHAVSSDLNKSHTILIQFTHDFNVRPHTPILHSYI